MMKNIGIIIELHNGTIKETNQGMITLARQKDCELTAFVMNADTAALKKNLEPFGITKIVNVCLAGQDFTPVEDKAFNPVEDKAFTPSVRADALIHAIRQFNIDAVFGLSTPTGKDLLPRMAALLDAPLVMDCFHVDLENNLAMTSQYSGKISATIKLAGNVLLFGVRPNCVEPVKAQTSAQLLEFDATFVVSENLKVIKTGDTDKNTSISLTEADVIVAGGRGMENPENFTLLSQCAEKLNAALGASRVAVDSGWVPYSIQVGQTGEKVNPRVYLACGISGSIQHFAGMKTSGMVIAINTDKTAAIMSNCDYFVVADALEIIPELIKALDNG
jgi:electron transfer flavoprotein alpha subunit